MQKKRQSLTFPREVLLIEIERHCADASCNARTRTGLTKEEARLYDGFECAACERWNEDSLTERDIPEWWEELTITGLGTLRAAPHGDAKGAVETGEGDGGVVARLSEAWQNKARREGNSSGGASQNRSGDGGDESL